MGQSFTRGDTGATPWIWREVRAQEGPKAIFAETSFPNRLSGLAELSGHLTPSMLEEELKKTDNLDVPIFIFPMKPQYLETLTAEIEQLNHPNIFIPKQGDKFTS